MYTMVLDYDLFVCHKTLHDAFSRLPDPPLTARLRVSQTISNLPDILTESQCSEIAKMYCDSLKGKKLSNDVIVFVEFVGVSDCYKQDGVLV